MSSNPSLICIDASASISPLIALTGFYSSYLPSHFRTLSDRLYFFLVLLHLVFALFVLLQFLKRLTTRQSFHPRWLFRLFSSATFAFAQRPRRELHCCFEQLHLLMLLPDLNALYILVCICCCWFVLRVNAPSGAGLKYEQERQGTVTHKAEHWRRTITDNICTRNFCLFLLSLQHSKFKYKKLS